MPKLYGNRYQCLECIGRGGMASVYLAFDVKLQRKVALKLMHKHMQDKSSLRKRFRQEARSVSNLKHPNILEIYDYSGDDVGELWIITEYVKGYDLNHFSTLFPHRLVHPLISACIIREIAKALNEAHRRDIIHRDIKASNIMITHEGKIKLMDFGIAKNLDANIDLTQTGSFVGSPCYMSPEQIKVDKIDARSDIYSLAILFFRLLTGKLPYDGDSTPAVIDKVMTSPVPLAKKTTKTVPSYLSYFVSKGMAKKPDDRHQNAKEVIDKLDKFLRLHQLRDSSLELELYFTKPKEFAQRVKTKIQAIRSIENDHRTNNHTNDLIKRYRQSNVNRDKSMVINSDDQNDIIEGITKVHKVTSSRIANNLKRNADSFEKRNKKTVKGTSELVKKNKNNKNKKNKPAPIKNQSPKNFTKDHSKKAKKFNEIEDKNHSKKTTKLKVSGKVSDNNHQSIKQNQKQKKPCSKDQSNTPKSSENKNLQKDHRSKIVDLHQPKTTDKKTKVLARNIIKPDPVNTAMELKIRSKVADHFKKTHPKKQPNKTLTTSSNLHPSYQYNYPKKSNKYSSRPVLKLAIAASIFIMLSLSFLVLKESQDFSSILFAKQFKVSQYKQDKPTYEKLEEDHKNREFNQSKFTVTNKPAKTDTSTAIKNPLASTTTTTKTSKSPTISSYPSVSSSSVSSIIHRPYQQRLPSGALSLYVTPPSNIYLDGKLLGNSVKVFKKPLYYKPGSYRLTIKKQGYNTYERNIVIRDRQILKLKPIILTKILYYSLAIQGSRGTVFSVKSTSGDYEKNLILSSSQYNLRLQRGEYLITAKKAGTVFKRKIKLPNIYGNMVVSLTF